MEHFFKFGNKLLTDRQEVIGLKKMMEEYVNSDKYSFEKWKDQFDEKFKDNFGGQSFTDLMKQTFDAVKGSLKLYCQRHLNANFIMFREAKLLTDKLVKLFGVDVENKGYYNSEKDDPKDDVLRKWTFENIELIFGTALNNGGNCYCLEIVIH